MTAVDSTPSHEHRSYKMQTRIAVVVILACMATAILCNYLRVVYATSWPALAWTNSGATVLADMVVIWIVWIHRPSTRVIIVLAIVLLLITIAAVVDTPTGTEAVSNSLNISRTATRRGIRASLIDASVNLLALTLLLLYIQTARQSMDLRAARDRLRRDKEALQRLVEVHERDRGRISREIHDGLFQQTSAARLLLKSTSPPPGEDGDETTHACELLAKSVEDARRIILGLRPPILDEEGLVAGIQFLVHEYAVAEPTLKIDFAHDLHEPMRDGVLSTTLFRVTQEALSNAARHGHCRNVQIKLKRDPGEIAVVIQDDGVGFDQGQSLGDRFGLEGIRERARLLGGRSGIESSRGQGTRIWVQLPLPRE